MSQFVLASGNKKKIEELKEILSPLQHELILQNELGIEDAVEDGLSFVENAIKKARHAAKASGLPAIADDSGIEVDALNGMPGIYSARFSGTNATDELNNQKLITDLNAVPEKERTARYQCVIVFLRHELDPTPVICQGSWEGQILTEPQGVGGFGYDPLFHCAEYNCSAAELTAAKKHEISHRGKALAQLRLALNDLPV